MHGTRTWTTCDTYLEAKICRCDITTQIALDLLGITDDEILYRASSCGDGYGSVEYRVRKAMASYAA